MAIRPDGTSGGYLPAAGLVRDDVFITNAVLCNPRDPYDRNRAPTRDELVACHSFLSRQLALVDPPLVVSLGVVALAALDRLEPHGLRLRTAVGRPSPWYGRLLVPLYHTGPRAQLHRSFAAQREDFRALGALLAEMSRALVGTLGLAPALPN